MFSLDAFNATYNRCSLFRGARISFCWQEFQQHIRNFIFIFVLQMCIMRRRKSSSVRQVDLSFFSFISSKYNFIGLLLLNLVPSNCFFGGMDWLDEDDCL